MLIVARGRLHHLFLLFFEVFFFLCLDPLPDPSPCADSQFSTQSSHLYRWRFFFHTFLQKVELTFTVSFFLSPLHAALTLLFPVRPCLLVISRYLYKVFPSPPSATDFRNLLPSVLPSLFGRLPTALNCDPWQHLRQPCFGPPPPLFLITTWFELIPPWAQPADPQFLKSCSSFHPPLLYTLPRLLATHYSIRTIPPQALRFTKAFFSTLD